MKKFVLLVLVALMGVAARAATETVNGVTWNYRINNGFAVTTGTSETDPAIPIATSGRVVVPSMLGGRPVVEVGAYTFSNCKNVKEIVIPEGIERCGWESFYEMGKLDSISFPSSLSLVGSGNVFRGTSTKDLRIEDLLSWMGIDNDDYWSSLPNADVVYLNGAVLETIEIPDGVAEVRGYCFNGFGSVKRIVVPASVNLLRGSAFCGNLDEIVFLGKAPAGLEPSNALSCKAIKFPRKYAASYRDKIKISQFAGFVDNSILSMAEVCAKVRESDPTILDVTYRVRSATPTVKVRALAFQDGERSFAKVVRPTDFIEGTAGNLGDRIATGVEHKLSWRVSSDWKIDLAKVKFEILAVEDDLLPLELVTIPKNGSNKAMEISWNAITEAQVFDALLWLYADGDAGLMLTNGQLKNGTAVVADGTSIKTVAKNANSSYDVDGRYCSDAYAEVWKSAPEYVFSKMGFTVLSGANLTYANEMTRLGLSPSGVRQYACRVIGE